MYLALSPSASPEASLPLPVGTQLFTDHETRTQNIKEGIEGKPVGWYSDVFELIFPDLDRDQASRCKICEWKENGESTDKDE
jgi:hypothetical protein